MKNAPTTAFTSLVLRANADGDGYHCQLQSLHNQDLPSIHSSTDVMVAVEYSSLNYKDALAITAAAPVVRQLPLIPGIDLAGRVLSSESPAFKVGDPVLATGWGMGEKFNGGLSERARVAADWLLPIPSPLTSRMAMALGTAGLTAMLCVLKLEDAGIRPDDGPILVSGASGGVGSVAVTLLAGRGYQVSALTGRTEQHDYLKQLGASEIVPRQELSEPSRPLEKQRWAAAIDTAGGQVLAGILARLNYGGCVAACGLAADSTLTTTVMPFILRGVTLHGVDSVQCPISQRQRAWQALAKEMPAETLQGLSQSIPLKQVPAAAEALLAGRLQGRTVVDIAMSPGTSD